MRAEDHEAADEAFDDGTMVAVRRILREIMDHAFGDDLRARGEMRDRVIAMCDAKARSYGEDWDETGERELAEHFSSGAGSFITRVFDVPDADAEEVGLRRRG